MVESYEIEFDLTDVKGIEMNNNILSFSDYLPDRELMYY